MMGFGLLGIVLIVSAILVIAREGSGLKVSVGTEKVSLQENANPNALEILNQRYAYGEITREQYQNIKKELS